MLYAYCIHSFLTAEDVMEKAEAKKKELAEKYPVSKNLLSIRPKGVWVEDIVDGITDLATTLNITTDIFMFGTRSGIPTAVVYLNNKQDWLQLRGELRAKGLSR